MTNGIQPHGRGRRWIKILALAGLVATMGIIVGSYWLGRRSQQKPLPKPAELPKDVNQRLSGVTFRRSEKSRRVFVIHASRTLAFKEGGSTVLKDVIVEYFGHSGNRHDILTTSEGEYNPSSGNLSTPGEVELILNAPPSQIELMRTGKAAGETPAGSRGAREPVYITTSQVTSHNHGTQLESGTLVHFHLGNISGTAHGLAYGSGKGEIELKRDVEAVFQPAKGSGVGSPIQVAARRLLYAGAHKAIQLLGTVEVRQGNRDVTAEQGSIMLDAQNRVTRVVLDGKTHASDRTQGGRLSLRADVLRGHINPSDGRLSMLIAAGHVRAESSQGAAVTNLEAHQVQLNFNSATHVPAHGVAMGDVHLAIAQMPGQLRLPSDSANYGGKVSKEDLATKEIRFSFRPSGKNLKDAATSGPGTLVLYPENPKDGDRTVTAARFLMSFDSSSHLESLRGAGGTKVVFEPSKDTPDQTEAVSSADRFLATFVPSTEMLQSVVQSGNFHFRRGTLQATAKEARDLAHEQQLILTGDPEVWDPTTRARADRVVVLLSSDTAEGIGGVHAVHIDPRDPHAPPTNVVADRMIADRRSQVVRYEGHVRAWRGTDVVESNSLDVYKEERRVSTNSRVITSHLQPAPSNGGSRKAIQSGPTPLTIRADKLDYLNVGRRARYTGHVELDTEDTRIQADQLDVYFSPGKKQAESEVERAVAHGHVKIIQPMRYANGEKAVYDARKGMVVMTGGPPRVYDTEKGSMTGQRLTFYTHNDRLLVDGNANAPAISKHRVAQ